MKSIDAFLQQETETMAPLIIEFMRVPLARFNDEQLRKIIHFLVKESGNKRVTGRRFNEFAEQPEPTKEKP